MATSESEASREFPWTPPRLEVFDSLPRLAHVGMDFGAVSPASYRPRPASPSRTAVEVLLPVPKQERFRQAALTLFETSVSLVLHSAADDDAQEYIEETLYKHVKTRPVTGEVIKTILGDVPSTAANVRGFRAAAYEVIPAFEEEAAADREKSFVVAQVMANHPLDVHIQGTRGEQEELLALLWAGHAAHTKQQDPHMVSMSQLKEGRFDELIAEEVLTTAVTRPSDEAGQHPQAEHLKQFVTALMASFDLEEQAAIAGMSSTAGFSLWLPGTFEAVEVRRQDYAQRLEHAYQLRRIFLRNNFLELPKTNLNQFRQQVNALDKLVPGPAAIPRRPTKADEMASRVEGRKHGLDHRQPSTPRSSLTAAEVELVDSAEKEPIIDRSLRYITKMGDQHEQGSKVFEGHIDEYLKNDGDGELKRDVESALEFLRVLDLSKGPNGKVPGVKQRTGERINYSTTGQKLPVYELKPKEAGKNASTKSNRGDAMRLNFVILPDGSIGILDIYDRKMMSRGRSSGYSRININEMASVKT